MPDIKEQLIRLGTQKPELRKHIRPVLDRLKKAALPTGDIARSWDRYRWEVYHPEQLLSLALRRNMITKEEYDAALTGDNDALAEAAQNQAMWVEDSYAGTGFGIGSSDISIFLKNMMRDYKRSKRSSRSRVSRWENLTVTNKGQYSDYELNVLNQMVLAAENEGRFYPDQPEKAVEVAARGLQKQFDRMMRELKKDAVKEVRASWKGQ